jgi:hypothetical protein
MRLITERNEAISQARFWRKNFFIIGIAAIVSNGVTVANWLGWI